MVRLSFKFFAFFLLPLLLPLPPLLLLLPVLLLGLLLSLTWICPSCAQKGKRKASYGNCELAYTTEVAKR